MHGLEVGASVSICSSGDCNVAPGQGVTRCLQTCGGISPAQRQKAFICRLTATVGKNRKAAGGTRRISQPDRAPQVGGDGVPSLTRTRPTLLTVILCSAPDLGVILNVDIPEAIMPVGMNTKRWTRAFPLILATPLTPWETAINLSDPPN